MASERQSVGLDITDYVNSIKKLIEANNAWNDSNRKIVADVSGALPKAAGTIATSTKDAKSKIEDLAASTKASAQSIVTSLESVRKTSEQLKNLTPNQIIKKGA